MTRQWNVPPKVLCDPSDPLTDNNHLGGEYNEMHKLLGGVVFHPYGDSILHGQLKENNIDLSTVSERYDKLAVEMKRRGYKHDAVLIHTPVIKNGYETQISTNRNLEELYEKCEDCKRRIQKHLTTKDL